MDAVVYIAFKPANKKGIRLSGLTRIFQLQGLARLIEDRSELAYPLPLASFVPSIREFYR